MTIKTCVECYYYILDVPEDFLAPGYDGWCYRYPSVCTGKREGTQFSNWESPSVSENHWCGEFLYKEAYKA